MWLWCAKPAASATPLDGDGAIRVGAFEGDGNEAVFLGRYPFLCDGRAKHVAKQGLASGGVERAGAGCGMQREPIE